MVNALRCFKGGSLLDRPTRPALPSVGTPPAWAGHDARITQVWIVGRSVGAAGREKWTA